ncbi:MAG: SIS domain-containing protein [Candidatus Eremiobacteraeota bacterium]|nr:SIS domain-containing protein [Candidatus Eremiobacteraeota bacterium]
MSGDYVEQYLAEAASIVAAIDRESLRKMVDLLVKIRERKGRLFFLGVGGGAGNASHAVNDFRKIAGMEAYAPTDNASELTARVNDEGWAGIFASWLATSRLGENDGVFVFSVGGGNAEKGISANIVEALKYAQERKAAVLGVVGRDGGFTARVADACVVVPAVNGETVTPHTESFQSLLGHLLVTHPRLKAYEMKWESVK